MKYTPSTGRVTECPRARRWTNSRTRPSDYARVLKAYIRAAGIDTSTLTIYATDIGALPALLLALEEPDIARTIIVGDFAPFDRPAFMYESLQGLKSQPSAEHVRAALNKNRDEILANTFTRGLPEDAKFAISPEFQQDLATGWNHGTMTSADAFYHYYAHFTRDQQYFESNLARLKTPVKVVWGEKDLYINKAMGEEFAQKTNSRARDPARHRALPAPAGSGARRRRNPRVIR